jgi:PAS domain S-box-containing protein
MIEALNQQDNLIRALFLDSLQPALISDADTLEILIANKACIEALKVDENDVIGHKWSDFFGLKEGIDISGSISVVKIVIGKSDAKWASVTAQYIQYEGRSVVIMRFSVFENQFQDLEQLEYNRKLYNDVFDQSYDAKLLTKIFSDGSFGDFTCNKRALELFEIHDASVFYSDRYRFFDDDVDVYALSKKAIQDGFIELELKMKTYAGITFWGLLKISKILVSYDEYLLTSIVDISVNKQTLAINAEREAKLVENEAYLKSIINTLPNPLFVKTMEGKFLLANEAFAKLVGQTPESIVSKTEVDINSDIDIVRTYFEHDKKVLDEGRTIVFSEEYLNDKGETKQLLTYKKPYLTLDGSSQIIGAILDVTNIVELEKELSNRNEMFEVIFKNSSDALFIVSENDIIQDVNDTCVNMFRMPKYDLIGKRGVTLQKNQFNEQKTASIYELLNSQKYFQTELQYIRGDGTEFCGLFSITLFELHGVQLALVRVADIDDQKQLAR